MKTRDYVLRHLKQEVNGRPGGWRSTIGFAQIGTKTSFTCMVVTVITLEDTNSDDDQQHRLVAYCIQEAKKVLRPDHPKATKLSEWHFGTLRRTAAEIEIRALRRHRSSRGLGSAKQESIVMSF